MVVTNLVNGKVYIGKTTLATADARWKGHVSAARLNHGSPYLGAAIRKYGTGSFTVEEIDSASDKDDLNKKERHYIALHKSHQREIGYNLTLGGDGGVIRHSEETKKKIAAGRQGVNHPMYGRHHSEEAKLRISQHTQGSRNPFFGKKHTTLSRQSMGARGEDHPNFGQHLSESTKQKIRIANSKTFTLRSPEGETVRITNLKGFCAQRGLSAPHMNSVFHGGRGSHKGWTRCWT